LSEDRFAGGEARTVEAHTMNVWWVTPSRLYLVLVLRRMRDMEREGRLP
jgi:hypothetical protein